jgi:hypothetical protein
MKWLIWTPAIVIILSGVAIPGGLVLFGLPLLALGYFLFSVIAVGGSAEHRAATRARAAREQRKPASHRPTEGVLMRRQPEPSRATFVMGACGLGGTTTRRSAA